VCVARLTTARVQFGKRTNTREQRLRERLMKERNDLALEALRRGGAGRVQLPAGVKIDTRLSKKFPIPQGEPARERREEKG
jgi:hypothetical protein